jgi:RNA polymerase sigma-70 factor (ECF subfamily)
MPFNGTHSDNELLRLLKQGNDDAFTEIYLRYWDKLIVVAMHRLGNMEEAREVVQNVFCNLWKRRASLEISHTLNTYLATAIKYEVFKRFASKSRQQQYQKQAFLQWEEAATETEDYLQANELQAQIYSLVKALPEKCRIVFQLSREKGYSQKQIAAELGIAEKTVEAHLSAALRRLRTGLSHLFTFLFFL